MRGSCLCGDVVWEGTGPGELVHYCHCGMCRKVHGTPFATAAGFPASDFRFVAGEAGIRGYASSPGNERRFCGRCGSSVPGAPFDGTVFVPLGNVDGDPGGRPVAHIFVASKAPWYDVPDDELPRFDAYPPGYADAQSSPIARAVRRTDASAAAACAARSPSSSRSRSTPGTTATARAAGAVAAARTHRTFSSMHAASAGRAARIRSRRSSCPRPSASRRASAAPAARRRRASTCRPATSRSPRARSTTIRAAGPSATSTSRRRRRGSRSPTTCRGSPSSSPDVPGAADRIA